MHVKASPEVIRARMASDPHEHPIVPSEDVEEVLGLFAAEYGLSWVKHKVEIDTSELQPEGILEAFFDVVRSRLLRLGLRVFRLRALAVGPSAHDGARPAADGDGEPGRLGGGPEAVRRCAG